MKKGFSNHSCGRAAAGVLLDIPQTSVIIQVEGESKNGVGPPITYHRYCIIFEVYTNIEIIFMKNIMIHSHN